MADSDTLFKTHSVADFPEPLLGKVMSIKASSQLSAAVQELNKLNALCAPVYEDLEDGSQRFVGVLDVVGIVFFVLDALESELSDTQTRPGDFCQWLSESKALLALTVKDVIGKTKYGVKPKSVLLTAPDTPRWLPFVCLHDSAMLSDAMSLLGREHFHRVLVTSSTSGAISNIITQSAVVKVLAAHLDKYASVADKTLAQLGLAESRAVFGISVDDVVMSAFKAMKDHRISGVPLLDENGAVVGCISDRHIRHVIIKGSTMHRPLYDVLAMPVTEFLASIAPEPSRHGEMHPAIICKATDKLGAIMKKLAVTRIHRIFLVDDDHRPIRVISLCDIIEVLLPAEEQLEHAAVASS